MLLDNWIRSIAQSEEVDKSRSHDLLVNNEYETVTTWESHQPLQSFFVFRTK